jgi:hypothetical protein
MIKLMTVFAFMLLNSITLADPLIDISKTGLQLENKKRIGLGLYEYTYTVIQLNEGNSASNVIGTVVSLTPNLEIVDSEFEVGTIQANSTQPSADTISIKIDRSSPFDPEDLSFSYYGESVIVNSPPSDDVEETSSYGILTTPLDKKTFHAVNETFVLNVYGAYFTSEAYKITVSRNGDLIENFLLSQEQLIFPEFIVNGINNVNVYATDDSGSPMSFEATFWGGSKSIDLSVVDENGDPVIADVIFKLSDSPDVTKFLHYEASMVTVSNLPSRTIIIEAQTKDDEYGSTAFIAGNQSSAEVVVKGIAAPSTSSNLQFKNGTDGWVVAGPGNVSILP